MREDLKYDYRVRLVPMLGSKTDADLAISFVRLDDLTDDERHVMTEAGRQGTVIVRDRHVEVADKDLLLPSQVAKEVEDQLSFKFSASGEHAEMWKRLKVRPGNGAPDPYATDAKYCVYSKAYQRYSYTQAWVKRIIKEIGTVEKYRKFFGRNPRMKPTTANVPRQAGTAGTRPVLDQCPQTKAA